MVVIVSVDDEKAVSGAAYSPSREWSLLVASPSPLGRSGLV